jgi:hypothetical protein
VTSRNAGLVAKPLLRHLPHTQRPAIFAVAHRTSDLSRYTGVGIHVNSIPPAGLPSLPFISRKIVNRYHGLTFATECHVQCSVHYVGVPLEQIECRIEKPDLFCPTHSRNQEHDAWM